MTYCILKVLGTNQTKSKLNGARHVGFVFLKVCFCDKLVRLCVIIEKLPSLYCYLLDLPVIEGFLDFPTFGVPRKRTNQEPYKKSKQEKLAAR